MQLKFQYPHLVQYYETDQMKIVHHSNYIRWFEESRVAWMISIGLPVDILEQKGIIIPVVDVSCKYRNMTRFGETVLIEPTITKFNGVVLEFSYRVTDKATGELKATGISSHCFINSAYKVIALKKTHKDIYDQLMSIYLQQQSN